jgi:hypothetical protein
MPKGVNPFAGMGGGKKPPAANPFAKKAAPPSGPKKPSVPPQFAKKSPTSVASPAVPDAGPAGPSMGSGLPFKKGGKAFGKGGGIDGVAQQGKTHAKRVGMRHGGKTKRK